MKNSYSKKWLNFIQLLKTLTVEPASILYMTSIIMCFILNANLKILTACLVTRNNSMEVCTEIVNTNGSFATEETEIEKTVTDATSYSAIIENTFAFLSVFIIGNYGDKNGRRLPLLLSAFGGVLYTTSVLIVSFYTHLIGPYWHVVITSITGSIFGGGEIGFCLSAYSYMSDNTDLPSRTFRTGILSMCFSLGSPLGFAITGTMLGFGLSTQICILTAVIFSISSFLVVYLTVHNPNAVHNVDIVNNNNGNVDKLVHLSYGSIAKPKKNNDTDAVGVYEHLCSFPMKLAKSVRDVFLQPFEKCDKDDRIKIILLLVVYLCVAGPINGEFSLSYLFVRHRLGWNATEYGYFSIYNYFIAVAGVCLSMGILVKWLKLSDPLVGFIAGLSQMAGSFVYAFAVNITMMFLAPAVDMMNGTMHVIARSMMSKIVAPDNVGKLFSLISILDIVSPFIIIPVYNSLYKYTVDSFSGAYYLLSAALTVPPQLIYLWFVWSLWRQKKSMKMTPEERDPLITSPL